jgi:uncharacterized coiled-coil DUF342 family protein
MEDYKLSLTALEKRINRLMELHQISVENVNRLVQERDDLVRQNEALKQDIRQLQQEREALRIVNAIPEQNEDRAEMKKRVKELMREVDECIALLNK